MLTLMVYDYMFVVTRYTLPYSTNNNPVLLYLNYHKYYILLGKEHSSW